MKRAVFYGRYSSDRQTEQSIEGQRRVCEEFAAGENIQIVREYIDRATSGTSTQHREQFQQMISDSKTGGWDYVLVYKLDRFARNRYDSAVYKRELKRNGVTVLSATERITDSPEGVLIEGLLESMDEYFSRELSRKAKRGMRESILKGHCITRLPYGYKRTGKTCAIDEDAADVIRWIFREYSSGKTIQEIVDTLNIRGFRTMTGKRFKRPTVSVILRNDKYTGTHYVSDFEEPERYPQIISQTMWDSVQSRLRESANRYRKHNDGFIYALTGKINCGYCGYAVNGITSNHKYHYYRCVSGKYNKHICDGCSVRADVVETAVVDALQEYFTAERVEEMGTHLYDLYRKSAPTERDDKRRLAEVDMQITGAVNALIACPESEALQNRLRDLEEQKREIEQSHVKHQYLEKSHFVEFFRNIVSALEHIDVRTRLFSTLIESVSLYRDHVVIIINLMDDSTDPPTPISLEKYFSSSVGNGRALHTLDKIQLAFPFLLLYVSLPERRNQRERP